MKSILYFLLIPLVILSTGCPADPGLKVYEHIPEQAALNLKGFYRNEGKEVITYAQASGFYAVSKTDMEFILNKLKQCEGKTLTGINNAVILSYLLGE